MSSDSLRIEFSELPSPERGNGGKGGSQGRGPTWRPRSIKGILIRLAGLVGLAILPFYTLIRSSVFLYHHAPVSGWWALAGGTLLTVLLLMLYLALLSFRLGGKGRVPKSLRRGTALLVAAYCAYGLVYLSSANAKSQEVRDTYSRLDPVLRVAVSTLLLVDRDGVLTDTERTREDYAAWGLPANEASLHLVQSDGYAHAVDVRTLGRAEWRNRMAAWYFQAMGFRVLRHVGTADHLHVELALRPPPPGGG
jgi:hypothetical protein